MCVSATFTIISLTNTVCACLCVCVCMCARMCLNRTTTVRLNLKEFGDAGMRRTLIVVYTIFMCINAFSPLLLHYILARQTQPLATARWIRYALLYVKHVSRSERPTVYYCTSNTCEPHRCALLFSLIFNLVSSSSRYDALSDAIFSFLPLGYATYGYVYYYFLQPDALRAPAERVGVDPSQLVLYALLTESSEMALGGRTPFAMMVKLKSRVLTLFTGPRKVLTAFEIRYWAEAERAKVLGVARTVVARLRVQKDIDSIRAAFHIMLRQSKGAAVGESKQSSDKDTDKETRQPRSWSRLASKYSSVSENAARHLQRARSLSSLYKPVPLWAHVLFILPATVCCIFILARIASVGQCDKRDLDSSEAAACLVPTFVRHTLHTGSSYLWL